MIDTATGQCASAPADGARVRANHGGWLPRMLVFRIFDAANPDSSSGFRLAQHHQSLVPPFFDPQIAQVTLLIANHSPVRRPFYHSQLRAKAKIRVPFACGVSGKRSRIGRTQVRNS